MKKIFSFLIILILMLFPLGCTPSDSGKLKLYVTIYPIYDFAQKIAGDRAEITMVASADSHHYEPTFSDIKNIIASDILLYNGAGLEHWLEDIMDTLSNENVKRVPVAEGVTLIDSEGLTVNNSDSHTVDPHIWLNPLNAKKMAENIKTALVQADPDGAAYYNANFASLAEKFTELDNEYKTKLSGITIDTVIVTHKAFGYICNAYNFKQEAAQDENAEGELSSSVIERLTDIIDEKGIKIVFYDELEGDSVANSLLENSSAEKIMPLSPINALTEEQKKTGADYFSLMRSNLAALEEALKA